MTTPSGDEALLTRDEVAKRLRMGADTLRRLQDTGEFPRPIQISPGVFVWTEADVAAHLYRMANRHRFRAKKPPKTPRATGGQPGGKGPAPDGK